MFKPQKDMPFSSGVYSNYVHDSILVEPTISKYFSAQFTLRPFVPVWLTQTTHGDT